MERRKERQTETKRNLVILYVTLLSICQKLRNVMAGLVAPNGTGQSEERKNISPGV